MSFCVKLCQVAVKFNSLLFAPVTFRSIVTQANFAKLVLSVMHQLENAHVGGSHLRRGKEMTELESWWTAFGIFSSIKLSPMDNQLRGS